MAKIFLDFTGFTFLLCTDYERGIFWKSSKYEKSKIRFTSRISSIRLILNPGKMPAVSPGFLTLCAWQISWKIDTPYSIIIFCLKKQKNDSKFAKKLVKNPGKLIFEFQDFFKMCLSIPGIWASYSGPVSAYSEYHARFTFSTCKHPFKKCFQIFLRNLKKAKKWKISKTPYRKLPGSCDMEFFQRTISQDLFYERYTKMKEPTTSSSWQDLIAAIQ